MRSDVVALYVDPRGACSRCGHAHRNGKGECKACARLRARDWRANNRDRHRAYTRAWEARNPGAMGAYKRRRDTGWTLEAFERAWAEQSGRCAICVVEMLKGGQSKTSVASDHCHATKRPRALLCQACNFALGLMADDPVRLRAAAEYLERFR